MATVKQFLDPKGGDVSTSAIPELQNIIGTNYPECTYAFTVNTNEALYFRWKAASYGSGNVTVKVVCAALTATSGTITFGAALSVITPDTDNQDFRTDAFATENTANATAASSAGRLLTVTITVSNLDSLAADDMVKMRVRRTDNGATGDVVIIGPIEISYSDT